MNLINEFVDKVAKKYDVTPGALIEAIIVEHIEKTAKKKMKKVAVTLDMTSADLKQLRNIAKSLHISVNSLIMGVTLFESRRVLREKTLKAQYKKFQDDLFKEQCEFMEEEMAKEDKRKAKKSIKSK